MLSYVNNLIIPIKLSIVLDHVNILNFNSMINYCKQSKDSEWKKQFKK